MKVVIFMGVQHPRTPHEMTIKALAELVRALCGTQSGILVWMREQWKAGYCTLQNTLGFPTVLLTTMMHPPDPLWAGNQNVVCYGETCEIFAILNAVREASKLPILTTMPAEFICYLVLDCEINLEVAIAETVPLKIE